MAVLVLFSTAFLCLQKIAKNIFTSFVKDLNTSQRISKLDPEDEKQASNLLYL